MSRWAVPVVRGMCPFCIPNSAKIPPHGCFLRCTVQYAGARPAAEMLGCVISLSDSSVGRPQAF
jgi:hypothetical protein